MRSVQQLQAIGATVFAVIFIVTPFEAVHVATDVFFGDVAHDVSADATIVSHESRQQARTGSRVDVAALKVAFAVIAPFGILNSSEGWKDGFRVLSHSARIATGCSNYSVDFLAFLPDGLETNKTKERTALERLGWKPHFVPIPVRLADVKNADARDVFSKVLGEGEELKYYGAALTQYDRVLVMDADTIFLQPIDELMDISPTSGLVGIYDHEMDIPISVFPPVNSGFLLFTPSKSDFEGLSEVFKEGDITAAGFRGSGTGWTYGAGSQGILSFFYNQWKPGKPGFEDVRPVKGSDLPGEQFTTKPEYSRFYPLDRSVYNVIDTDALQEAVRSGRATSDRVKVYHFAGKCLKPWLCRPTRSEICEKMTQRWWDFRREVEVAEGLPPSVRCAAETPYKPMELMRHSGIPPKSRQN
eukprot:TRINITY_DN61793_c0_g1_i1.p1 TRINITY_DN61793_c0_g1~~TRINITY_DN61793_c0_g1_i1.p1  ORF type:complete len:415 (-),score=68.43 TRINITY_DN61793_c0_g1_i1:74-1318(-)